jgi:tRNA (adenine22-N1)-methyltransferase
MMLRLDARLAAAAELFPVCKVGVDLAADHGKLACYLVQSKKCEQVIASDISPVSVEKMNHLVNKLGLNESISVRQGDGWSVIDQKVDAVAILGLGGESIARIIDQITPFNGHYPALILSAHTHLPVVRFKLQDRGYAPLEERIVWSNGRFYKLNKATVKERILTQEQLLLGFNVRATNNVVLLEYWKWKYRVESKKKPTQIELLSEIEKRIEKCKPQ